MRNIEKIFKRSELKGLKFGLENIQQLSAYFGFPQEAFSSVHVAGTNGKGSCTTKIAKGLELDGKKVGLYTSPHLLDISERIQINGKPIAHADLDHWLGVVFDAEEKLNLKVSFFEVLTMAAFLYFREQAVDFVAVEVGLGGRLDATNIIHPKLSVITSISLDHCAFLGDTLEKIASEKGGIIKEEVPVVLGPKANFSILKEIAKLKKAPLYLVEEAPYFFDEENQLISRKALEVLEVSNDSIEKALQVRPPFRYERKQVEGVDLIFDVGHNPDGLTRVLQKISVDFPTQPLVVLVGMSEDKDVKACLSLLEERSADVVLIQADHERASSVEKLSELIKSAKKAGSVFDGVELALKIAKEKRAPLLVTGSFFIMPEVVKAILPKLL